MGITSCALSLILYIVSWTLVYDTIYACQDRPDDVKAGVKSTAVLFGDHVRVIVASFASIFVSFLCVSGLLNGNGFWYFVLSCGGTACHLMWQLATWDVSNARSCAVRFKVCNLTPYLINKQLIKTRPAGEWTYRIPCLCRFMFRLFFVSLRFVRSLVRFCDQ